MRSPLLLTLVIALCGTPACAPRILLPKGDYLARGMYLRLTEYDSDPVLEMWPEEFFRVDAPPTRRAILDLRGKYWVTELEGAPITLDLDAKPPILWRANEKQLLTPINPARGAPISDPGLVIDYLFRPLDPAISELGLDLCRGRARSANEAQARRAHHLATVLKDAKFEIEKMEPERGVLFDAFKVHGRIHIPATQSSASTSKGDSVMIRTEEVNLQVVIDAFVQRYGDAPVKVHTKGWQGLPNHADTPTAGFFCQQAVPLLHYAEEIPVSNPQL